MTHTQKTITVTDLRVDIREILENAHFRGWEYVVERAGQPMVVILNIEEYRRLLDALAQQTEPVHSFAQPSPSAVPSDTWS